MPINKISNLLFLILLLSLFLSCRKNTDRININSKFVIEGKTDSTIVYRKIYLSYLIGDQPILIDSSDIKEQEFFFEGSITSPKKTILQFYPDANFFPFILYGERIKIEVNSQDIQKSEIINSEINLEWENVKNTSKTIYGEIDYYYPIIQKARIQNDYVTLNKLSKTIDSLEVVNRTFLKNYIKQNNRSPLSVLLLNDLYANPKNDSIEIVNLSSYLHPTLQKMLDF